jgi:hypothetical protein
LSGSSTAAPRRSRSAPARLRAAACAGLILGGSAMAVAETPRSEAPSSARAFCQQGVDFRLTDPAAVPERFRRFLGVWSDAAWDVRTCAALIVSDIKADGTASILYVWGPLGSSAPSPGGVLHGSGVIRAGELRFQNSDGTQFAFRPGLVDLEGRLTTPRGQTFSATFKRTP